MPRAEMMPFDIHGQPIGAEEMDRALLGGVLRRAFSGFAFNVADKPLVLRCAAGKYRPGDLTGPEAQPDASSYRLRYCYEKLGDDLARSLLESSHSRRSPGAVD